MDVAKRRTALEAEIATLRKLLAGQSVDVSKRKEMFGMGAGERHAFERACGPFRDPFRGGNHGPLPDGTLRSNVPEGGPMEEKGYSQRRAHALAGIDPRVIGDCGPACRFALIVG